jgi:hypothetical protein
MVDTLTAVNRRDAGIGECRMPNAEGNQSVAFDGTVAIEFATRHFALGTSQPA